LPRSLPVITTTLSFFRMGVASFGMMLILKIADLRLLVADCNQQSAFNNPQCASPLTALQGPTK
jgi:hypothetical protein